MSETKPKFEIVNRVSGEPDGESRKEELERLIEQYSCVMEAEPEWCVYGRHYKDQQGMSVLYWLLPEPESKMVAYKMVKIINQLGGEARVEMTEWNKDITGEPVYKKKGKVVIDVQS